MAFLLQTEVHAYAFAIAANLLLSFFPFLVLILSVCQHVLHWRQAVEVVYLALDDFLPGEPEVFGFLRSNLRAAVASQGQVAVLSVVLLLFTSNGVFQPLEVALNRVWGLPRNRSLLRNQVVSFGLITVCGALALLSAVLTAANRSALAARWEALLLLKAAAVPVSIAVLFLVYWLLPNGRLPWRPPLAAAVVTGAALEGAKYLYIRIWPLLDFRRAYGPFFISATIVIWGFLAALVVLAGAELSARGRSALPGALPHLNKS